MISRLGRSVMSSIIQSNQEDEEQLHPRPDWRSVYYPRIACQAAIPMGSVRQRNADKG